MMRRTDSSSLSMDPTHQAGWGAHALALSEHHEHPDGDAEDFDISIALSMDFSELHHWHKHSCDRNHQRKSVYAGRAAGEGVVRH